MESRRIMTRSRSQRQSTETTATLSRDTGSQRSVMHSISNIPMRSEEKKEEEGNQSDMESEEEDNGKAEVEDEELPLSQPLPAFLKDILQQLDVREDLKAIQAATRKPVSAANYKAVLFEGNPVETEKGDDTATKLYILQSYLATSASIASCYPAATRLLELVGVDVKNGSFTYTGGGETDSFRGEEQANLIEKLCKDLQDAGNKNVPIIFKVQLGGKSKGGHGFTLTVQDNAIYQIEALAGQGRNAQTMLSNIMKGVTPRSISEVTDALRSIASNEVENRIKGANTMGWNADMIALISEDKKTIVDPMNVFWIAYPVASADQIRDQVTAQIKTTRENILRIVAESVKSSDPGERQNKRRKK
jgi:hypothetical protein